MQANHQICFGCRYRMPATHTCELGAVDKPSLCPRTRATISVALDRIQKITPPPQLVLITLNTAS